jgi:subtilisin family serine protease
MIHPIRSLLVACSLLIASAASASLSHAEEIRVASNQYIVQRKPVTDLHAQRAGRVTYFTKNQGEHFDVVVPIKAGTKSLSASFSTEPVDWLKVAEDCKEIAKDPSIETCEPNTVQTLNTLPNDPLLSLQWGLFDTSVNDADIRANIAWNYTTGSKSTLIGVIDSGIYWQHPDLSSNLWSNPGDPYDGVDNDANGYVDDIFGIDAGSGTNDPNDCSGHGTHVSGIIGAASNNGIGVSGLNWTTSLIVARVAEDCSGSGLLSHSLEGYNYFYGLKRKGHNIRAINASLGSFNYSPAEYAAIQRLNSVDILLVAAAGNETTNVDITPAYPAGYDLPNIISVGATGPTLARPVYSNYGQTVDIAAPGGDQSFYLGGIYSTWSPLSPEGVLYKFVQGTSMAAPMVTGAIGLLASQRPYLNGTHLKGMVLFYADHAPALDPYVANGRFLNVGALAVAPDPADNCPADPNKIEPGICGCGTTDLYIDSDGDRTYNCIDQCTSDPSKTAPGNCGCGISDADTNGNGVADCSDPVVAGIVPTAPSLKSSKRNLTISVTPKSGVVVYLKVVIKPTKGKTKTSYYTLTAAIRVIKKLAAGATVTVQYAYMLNGTNPTFSYYSPAKKIKIK